LSGTGKAKNFKKGVIYLQKAADQNYEQAFYPLGMCYEKGTGVVPDKRKALKWYQKTASLGGTDGEIAKKTIMRLGN
jgi:TPR repeat protein